MGSVRNAASAFAIGVAAIASLGAVTGCQRDAHAPLVASLVNIAPAAEPAMDADLAMVCTPRAGASDEDADGLPDDCEQELAERYAPVVYHSSDESNFPTNVDRFLEGSHIGYYDTACGGLAVPIVTRPRQADLVAQRHRSCAGGALVVSNGTRSLRKNRTFYLEDVRERRGSRETREWTTYVHAYKNDRGGVTLQYWRFYAYNDAFNDHGGDWEGIHVVLDRALRPVGVRLLAHSKLEELPFASLDREGTHVHVFSEGGGHGTRATGDGIEASGCDGPDCAIDPSDPRTYVRQETWTGGRVTFPWKPATPSGALVNIGAKERPLHGQKFVAYSGLWGSPGFLYGTSGYWGPAFNETAMRTDGFMTAWCAGMIGDDVPRECYARDVAP